MTEKIDWLWLIPVLGVFIMGIVHLESEYPLTIQYLPDNNPEDILKGYTEVTYYSPLDYAPRAVIELICGVTCSFLLSSVVEET